ncbi:MAG: FAD-binding protein [Paracoccaceae bacterium]|jgi:glycolate oxidase FAD binding subunit
MTRKKQMKPESESELAGILSQASDPIWVQGGGTRGVEAEAEILSTTGLRGVSLYEPGALTLVASAGTPVSEIKAMLAGESQRLAFEPMDHRALMGTKGEPTIGGVFAANVSGPRRVQVGAARDFLLGVRFVDGRGQVVSNGGRVMKNVTGYDLVKLLAGSFGTLGVISQVSFKVLAAPESEASLVCFGQNALQAIQSLSAALGAPFDISGGAYLEPGAADGEGRTQVRIEGFDESVRYRAGQLQAGALQGFEVVEGAASAALWQEVRDVSPFSSGDDPVWRISLKPTDAPVLSERLKSSGLDCTAIYDWGGGLVWLCVHGATVAQVIRREVSQLGGHATLIRGGQKEPRFHPQSHPLQRLSAGLRAKFDPKGILNPGLMG